LQFYLQALNPIEPFLSEPLETIYNGRNIYLLNTLHSALQQILSTISIKPLQPEVAATIGKGLDDPILFEALYLQTPISNFPLHFSFLKGEGELIDYDKTAVNGLASCRISNILSADKMQVIKAELALDKLVTRDDLNPIIQDIIKGLTIPSVNVLLNVSGPQVFIESTELNFGNPLDVSYIEPKLKEKLSEFGYSFVDIKSDADYVMIIEAQSRKGSTIYNMCSAFVDVTISVMDMSTFEEIYKNTFSNVKGINTDMDKSRFGSF